MRCFRASLVGVGLVALVVFGAASTAHAAESKKISHANEECINLLEQPGKTIDDCQKAPNPILPEGNEMVWGGIAFLVLVVLLTKVGLPPIKKALQLREDRIRQDLERAEQARTEAEQELASYQARLAEARAEGNRIVEEARVQAEQVRKEVLARAEAEAVAVKARADDDINLATDRARARAPGPDQGLVDRAGGEGRGAEPRP